ncbi:MAG: tetratricopeptide repeat protein [Planctomycetota bacterium]|nr:tetratricopeptide repeat protein [Planctomycetota bacterium]
MLRAGRFADARGHFEQAQKIQPNHPGIRFNLGLAQMKTGQIAEAIGSFQQALRIKPDMPEAHYNLGVCLCAQGKPGEGAAQWRQAIQLRPDNIVALNDTAWLLATCPDASVRNGKEAVELASKSVKQSGGKAPELLDTLAVAYAEAGQFPDALQTARRAAELADGQNKPALAAEIRSRIPLYESAQAYRQGPPRPATRPAGP